MCVCGGDASAGGDDTREPRMMNLLWLAVREERENQRLQPDVETLNKTRKIPQQQKKQTKQT